MVSAGTLYFIHPDHLGTPQRITDANQNIVWDAALRPFGEVEQMTQTFTLNLRFPGQYADAETGLNYNFFRDYDPSVGRYVESDPIGLRGGLNTYAYAAGDPARWLDRQGLAEGDFPPPPPGYDPNTWPSGAWPNNGKYWTQDPKNGDVYTIHPEDEGHWRHWDKQDGGGNDGGMCPPNSAKRRKGQKKAPYGNQSDTDPNGDAPAWTPPDPAPKPSVPVPTAPLPFVPIDPIPSPGPIIRIPIPLY
jgi:RHS repeat-associated protein